MSALLSGAVAYNYLQAAYLKLSVERLGVVADDIRQTLEGNLNIGLSLSAVQDTQALIERQRALNRGITSITVFGEAHRTLFSTDRATIGDALPAAWFPETATQEWSRALGDEVIVGAPVVNGFGQAVGGIVIGVSRAYVDFRKFEVFRPVAITIVAFSALALLVAFVAAALLARGPRTRLRAAMAEIARLRHEEASNAAPLPDAGPGPQAIAPFVASVTETIGLLRTADGTVQRLDETA